jgi:hypothetical protein
MIKNCGFVNTKWIIKGILGNNVTSMLCFELRTYDNKKHTFKELDYKSSWLNLTVVCMKLSPENSRLMNDCEEYVPSEISEISQSNEEVKDLRQNNQRKVKQKSSKVINERFSAHASKYNKSDLGSSYENYSVYYENNSDNFSNNAYG